MVKLDGPIVARHPSIEGSWILTREFEGIPAGFVTDFASVPRVFWSIISPTDLGDDGPVVHDWKYRNGIGTRKAADKEFLARMKRDGISWWRRTAAYNLVRACGWRSWNSGKVVIEELAPAQ